MLHNKVLTLEPKVDQIDTIWDNLEFFNVSFHNRAKQNVLESDLKSLTRYKSGYIRGKS